MAWSWDVIVVRDPNGNLMHSFFALSETLAFNKTNVGNHKPYEVLKIDDYYRNTRQDLSCQFLNSDETQGRDCQSLSSAYSCSIPEEIKNNLALGGLKSTVELLDDCGYRESVLGETSQESLNDLIIAVTRLATDALMLPSIEETPPEIQRALEDHLCRNQTPKTSCVQQLQGYHRKKFEIEARRVYLLASEEMKTEGLPASLRSAVEVARQVGFISKIPKETRVPLSMLYLGQTGDLEARALQDPVRREFLNDCGPFCE